MKVTYEQLLEITDDLLIRFRAADRRAKHFSELARLSETHAALLRNRPFLQNGPKSEWALATLTQMRLRLITLLEDVLYTA